TASDAAKKTAATTLGISWGADDDTRATGDTFGRQVGFASTGGTIATGSVAGTGVSAASVGLAISGATAFSGGVALTYKLFTLDNGGQKLVASAGAETVFEVILDPTST